MNKFKSKKDAIKTVINVFENLDLISQPDVKKQKIKLDIASNLVDILQLMENSNSNNIAVIKSEIHDENQKSTLIRKVYSNHKYIADKISNLIDDLCAKNKQLN